MKFAFFSHGITQAAADKLAEFTEKPVNQVRTLYITTAANTYPPDPDWMIETLTQLKEFGFNVVRFDLERAQSEHVDLEQRLSNIDIVFFSGGNAFYLNYWIRETGFYQLLRQKMQYRLVYAGESAGVVNQIADMTPIAWLDHPEQTPEVSYEGLQLTDYIVIPHWENPKYQEKLEKTKKYYEDRGLEVLTIQDNEALFIDNEKYCLIK